MARIPDAELERLKETVSVERLAQARGVVLRREGKDLVGLCPFHEDKTPSFKVTPAKNLWHCLGACQTGGSAVDFVMKAEGVSFRHAVELLRAGAPSLAAPLPSEARPKPSRQEGPVPKASTVRKLATTSELERVEGDGELFLRVCEFYEASLKETPSAQAYLASRGLSDPEMLAHFKLGFCDRTLCYRLPTRLRKDGAELRNRLQALGVLRASGHEHFRGSVVVPLFDERGQVVQMYGRKIKPAQRDTPTHLYLPGPQRGVFNPEAIAGGRDIILCEAIFDALSFWSAGYHDVTTCYGVGGFTDELREAFLRHKPERVFMAFDRDAAGDKGAERVGAELAAMGIEVLRVRFPHGMDANDFAQKVQPADQAFGAALRGAEWLAGKRTAPVARLASPDESTPAMPAPDREREGEATKEGMRPAQVEASDAARGDDGAAHAGLPSLAACPPSSPLPASPATAAAGPARLDAQGDVALKLGLRRYRIRGLARHKPGTELRVKVLVEHGNAVHVDTLELYSARQRAHFVKTASEELGLDELVVKKDLGVVLLELERLQDEALRAAAAPQHKAPELTEEERAAALALLRSPRLIERILDDVERIGIVGEKTNKLVGYLAATSRKLDEPLAVVVQSSSAAGKSALMDAVLALVPPEERVQYSAMTGQSLFYMGSQELKHKVLAIAEEEGAERASYALKLLQSEGELTIASTGKDPVTGKLVTHEYRVEGPVMIMMTTTAAEVDEELLNRCIVLTVDEGREQTRAIHARQRRAQTLAGVLEKEERSALTKLHQNAQRLLEPLLVVNPFAEKLGFADHRTRTRRDHMKYLTLIRVIALLHQHQRQVKTVEHGGRSLRYVEATERDITLANRLSEQVLLRGIDELSPQSQRLYAEVVGLALELAKARGVEPAAVRFGRKDVRARTGWGLSQLKVHMHRLEELELVEVVGGGPRRRLLYQLPLDYDANWPGISESGRPLAGAPDRPEKPNAGAHLPQLAGSDGGHSTGGNGKHRPLVVCD